jgi:hypothetical protein
MLLSGARLVGIGPFEDVTFPFADDAGVPRKTAVVLGGGGVGKTTLLAALASTRPGYAVAQRSRRGEAGGSSPPPGRGAEGERAPFVVADWTLAAEDAARPHPLRVASPNASLGEADDVALLRRREQALFDRRAAEGGYALVAFSAARWFSRSAVLLGGPERMAARHDPRGTATAAFDDATRADLARDTKQALSFPVVSAAVARATPRYADEAVAAADSLERAVRAAVAPLARLAGYHFLGAEPTTFEPVFQRVESHGGSGSGIAAFDDLPTHARHLVAFAALTVRALHAAWPRADARTAEGVALIDDAELHLDAAARRGLVPALCEALPHVQWIVATSSPDIALSCDAGDVLALRRMPESNEVRLFEGDLAVVH